MDFIEYDQPVLMIPKIKFGLGQFCPVLFGFEIEIERVMVPAADLQCQRCFADLARTQQCGCRRIGDGV